VTRIEPLSAARFVDRLTASAGVPELADEVMVALHSHHEELARWAPRVDLVGPGAARELFARHYAESLAALPWLPRGRFRLLDIGSGAGFPGLVLAAARSESEVWLVEPRQRRAAFLSAAVRRMGAAGRVRVVDARVAAHAQSDLPGRLDVVTQRALRLKARDYRALLPRLAPGARFLVWEGGVPPDLPGELVPGRRTLLADSRQRSLQEYVYDGSVA
jgi:16S rRNA (guanine527-N7)-methyltransferase